MTKKITIKPISAAVGATLLTAVGMPSAANAAENPFGMTDLASGYEVAFSSRKDEEAEGKCGEGKEAEGTCGEGKDAHEGSCGEGKAPAEGSCGEGKAPAEGSCGEGKAEGEGKCGEGKCGQ